MRPDDPLPPVARAGDPEPDRPERADRQAGDPEPDRPERVDRRAGDRERDGPERADLRPGDRLPRDRLPGHRRRRVAGPRAGRPAADATGAGRSRRPEPRGARPAPGPGQRLLRVAGMNVLIVVGALALLYGGSKLLHRPTGTEPRVAMPARMTRGPSPGPLDAGAYRLTLSDARWIPQADVPADAPLSFRARPSALVDYLVLDVRMSDIGSAPAALSYTGAGQDVRLLLASADPEAFVREPLSPAEARAITGQEPLPSGTMAAGEHRAGVLVYAVERYRADFRLLAVPQYAPGTVPQAGPAEPALEMRFRP